jgi:hypothetical protein
LLVGRYHVSQDKVISIGEVTFLSESVVTVRGVAKKFGANEVVTLPAFAVEPKGTLCGAHVWRFGSDEYHTGLGWMDTKMTRRDQIEIWSCGSFLLVRSCLWDLSRAPKDKDKRWAPSPETAHSELFLLFTLAGKHDIAATSPRSAILPTSTPPLPAPTAAASEVSSAPSSRKASLETTEPQVQKGT